jgi:hypothetical protein
MLLISALSSDEGMIAAIARHLENLREARCRASPSSLAGHPRERHGSRKEATTAAILRNLPRNSKVTRQVSQIGASSPSAVEPSARS